MGEKDSGNSIIEYVQDELRSFSAKPLCEVDSLVFSQLAKFNWDVFEGIPAKFADRRRSMRAPKLCNLFHAEDFKGLFPHVHEPHDEDVRLNWSLFASLVASPRFRDVRVAGYLSIFDDKVGEQFSVSVFAIPSGGLYVAFRGTDDSLVGWKEDFQLAFVSPVPAQQSALDYLEQVVSSTRARIYVGGHSKGGNLAVYAAAMLPEKLQRRIFAVYSHDGPGFPDEVLASPGFKAISLRINKTVPESSLVGMLLEQQEPYRIVKSQGKGGMEQHYLYNWVIEDGDLVRLDKLTSSAYFFDAALHDWLIGLDVNQKRLFTDALFDMLEETDTNLLDLFKPSSLRAGAAYLLDLDPAMRGKLKEIVGKLVAASGRNLFKRDND